MTDGEITVDERWVLELCRQIAKARADMEAKWKREKEASRAQAVAEQAHQIAVERVRLLERQLKDALSSQPVASSA